MDEDGDFADAWYEEKCAIMQTMLGPEHDLVTQTTIPPALEAGLDLFYYPSGIPGTAIATKELSEAPGEGARNHVYESYELVMFTRQALSLDEAEGEATSFGKMHRNIEAILNEVAPLCIDSNLNPGDTWEFPPSHESVGGKCLIFTGYSKPQKVQNACGMGASAIPFGLLTVIEVFREEMEYARNTNSGHLLEKLKAAGHYPYSDLDRDPVV